MPKTTIMSKRDVAQRTASLDKAIAKNVAKNVAKRAAKAKAPGRVWPATKAAAKTFAGKRVPVRARLAPPAKAAPVSNTEKLGAAIQAIADEKAAKAPNGAKGRIIAMIAAEGGTSAAEVCKALGWVRAGATIGRAIKLAPFKVAKVRDADGVLRYSRA
jgi:hypothetical protein